MNKKLVEELELGDRIYFPSTWVEDKFYSRSIPLSAEIIQFISERQFKTAAGIVSIPLDIKFLSVEKKDIKDVDSVRLRHYNRTVTKNGIGID